MKRLFLLIAVILMATIVTNSQTCQWAEKIAGTGVDIGNSIATDTEGNIYVAGYFRSSTLTFNNGKTLSFNGTNKAYIAKYNSNGICQWAEKIDGTYGTYANSISVDGDGNLYVAGYWEGSSTLTFNNGITLTNSINYDAYIAKYNSSGICQWAEKISGTSNDVANSIVVDGSGNVYVAGNFQSTTLTFNNGKTLSNSGDDDAFIAKYNSSGICQWAEEISGTSNDVANSIVVDGSGNVYVAGTFKNSTLNFNNSKSLTNTTTYEDTFIAKYNTSGTCQWAEKISGTSSDYAKSIAVDGSGNVYVAGYWEGSSNLNFNNGITLSNSTNYSDAFLAKYNSSGVCQWAEKIAGTYSDYANSVVVDDSGKIYVAGYFSSSNLSFNNGKFLTNSGSEDGYIAKYISNGTCLWVEKIAGSGSDNLIGITTGESSDVYITGLFTSSILSFNNSITLTNTGLPDALLAKYDARTNPLLSTKPVNNITSNSATCGGNVIDDGGGTISARGVCWSTNQNPTINDSKTTDGTGSGEFTSNITGLSPYTTYYVRAYATNTAGTSYGDQKVFSIKKRIYVKYDASGLNDGTSWTDAFTSLQTALSYATENSEIWVARGTYKPTVKVNGSTDRHKSFLLKKRISLIGGFGGTETTSSQRNIANNPTILSGDIGVANDSTDNCYHIVTYQVGDNFWDDDIFDGFTIKYGNSNSDNPDNRGAAMILNNNGTPTIQNCTFENNFSGFRGGAIYNGETSANFINCKFTNNSSTTEGGALFNYYAHYTKINNCEFGYNRSNSGGGIYNHYTDSLKIDSSTVMFNKGDNGAGIYLNYGNSNILNSEIKSNSNINNSGAGGGINSYFCNINLTNSIIQDNTASQGGGIYTNKGVILIIGCKITNNYTSYSDGGGLNLNCDSQTIYDSEIIDNRSVGSGGGIYLGSNNGNLVLNNCSISNNIVNGSGAGICCFSSYVKISMVNCKVSNNQSNQTGGGIFGKGQFTNCLITDNTSLISGGGVYSSGYFINCTITNNKSSKGGGFMMFSTYENNIQYFIHSILWGNIASIDGNEIYKESGTVTLDNSCYGNGNGDIFGTITANNCINTDPIFVDPNGDDYRVYGVSPCIDAGGDGYISELYDIRGEGFPRKLDGEDADLVGTVDIGAYEYKHGEDKYLPPALTTPVLIEPANNDNNLGRIAQFKWRKVENATGYRIQISNTNTFAIRFIDQVETDTVVTITDLNPFMTQYWRVAALNQADSLWSVVWSFTTNDIDQPTVTTNQVTEIGLYSAVSGGNVTDDGDGIVTARGICWATTQNPTINNNKTEDGTGTGEFTSNITGLTPNTKYYVRAYATNIAGTVYGSQVSFTTSAIIPPPSSWAFTDFTGNNSTIAIPKNIAPEMEDRFIQKNDAIGVFYNLNGVYKCAGYGLWNDENLALTVWGDNDQTSVKDGFEVNESYFIKLWDAQKGKEYIADFVISSGPSNYQINAITYLSKLNAELTIVQSIALRQGWNLISSNLHINQPDSVQYVWANLLNRLVIMKNQTGKIYLPNGVNQIGSWNLAHGYQTYINQQCTLNISGIKIKPENNPLALTTGWSIIPYLRQTALNIANCFATLNDRNSVTIAKNNAGKIYMPSMDINQIGNMLPGEGYQLYLNKVDTLIYPANSSGRSSSSTEIDDFDARFLKTDFENTGNNASLILDIDLADNTELAVLNSDNKIVGAGRVVDGKTVLAIWGDEEKSNYELQIMNYDSDNKQFYEINNLDLTDIISGTKYNKLSYNKDAVLIGKAITNDLKLSVNPNPFSNNTEVIYELSNDCEIELALFDISGRKVLNLANGMQTKGTHKLTINAENLTSGTYNVILKSCGKSISERVVVVK